MNQRNKRHITVIGCGRWGSCLAWYLDSIGHEVTLYGRATSRNMQRFLATRQNDHLTLPESIRLDTNIRTALTADTIVISVDSQGLRALLLELAALPLTGKTVVLCMKGVEISTGLRLSEIAKELLDESCRVAVWLGPGHVQSFFAGIPNCMVIDSEHEDVKCALVKDFSGEVIRLYYGEDLIGNEIGGAAKNVIGIAAGLLDGAGLSSLKGALMARGAREVARLICAMGGNELSAYGLCHLGDYEATLFSPYSHNRRYGEAFAKGEEFTSLAEGYYTVQALVKLEERYGVDLPICHTVYSVLHEGKDLSEALASLFDRTQKNEFYK